MGFSLLSLTITALDGSIAHAQQQFSDDQISRYAMAAEAIEGKRNEVLRRAKNNQGWASVARQAEAQNVSVCELSSSEQPEFLRNLCGELFTYSEQTIRNNGFSSNREFNQLTQAQQQNSQLQRRIQEKIVQMRGGR
jgi:chemotaxis protein histidine kinase CheA